MDIALWVVQGILAAGLLMAGSMKLMRSREQLQPKQAWVEDFSAQQVKGIGALEVLGAAGLILPGLLNVAEVLTPIAAVGLAILMAGAAWTHIRRNENANIPPPVVLMAGAIFVAIGRLGPEPL